MLHKNRSEACLHVPNGHFGLERRIPLSQWKHPKAGRDWKYGNGPAGQRTKMLEPNWGPWKQSSEMPARAKGVSTRQLLRRVGCQTITFCRYNAIPWNTLPPVWCHYWNAKATRTHSNQSMPLSDTIIPFLMISHVAKGKYESFAFEGSLFH